jgi:hypothetical protein
LSAPTLVNRLRPIRPFFYRNLASHQAGCREAKQ